LLTGSYDNNSPSKEHHPSSEMDSKTRLETDPAITTNRSNSLPRLQYRAQNIFKLIFNDLSYDEESNNPVLPSKTSQWFEQIMSEKETNGFEDAVELLKSFIPPWYLLMR
jgi:hypothetical protein